MVDATDSNNDKADAGHQPGTALVVASGEPASAEAAAGTTSWFGRMRAAAGGISSSRTAIAAAAIGFIGGAALLVASLGAMGVGHLIAAPKPPAIPPAAAAALEEARALKQTVAKLETQVTTLKASLETATRRANNQRAQITERYDHTARSQAELQSRLAKMGETVERLEKRVTASAASEVTGSVAPRYAAAAAAIQPPPSAAKPIAQRPILRGWIIRSVFNGRAIVVNRRGSFEAAPGLFVPGLGQIEEITRQGDRWLVIAENGIIRSMSRPPHPRAAYEFELR